jgi:hypothetical protein
VADPSSELTLLEGDNQDEMPGTTKAGHQGGGIAFAPDGTLYIAIGEQTANTPAQDLRSLLGKIVRLNRNGTIPADNPFLSKTTGKYRSIWARGLRNPWVLAFQPGTGRLYINDIGASAFEEINEGLAGENYGWPLCEGVQELPGYRDPVFEYGHAIGQSLGGGCFYPAPDKSIRAGAAWFPTVFHGKFLFQDYMSGWMGLIDPASPQKSVQAFARGLAKPTAVAVAPDGALLVLERNQWVKDGKFTERTGRLIRIAPTAGASVPTANPGPHAPTLSGSKLFTRLAPLTAAGGVVECDVRIPHWEPGARVRRWLELPAKKKAAVDQDGEFVFPPGTRIVRHIVSETSGRPLLTSVITILAGNAHRSATYQWRDDLSDADLIETPGLVELDGRRRIVGGPTSELPWPPALPGYVCDITPANLVTPALASVCDVKGKVVPYPRLEDPGRPVEDRTRAWLDVNCANCHRPGGLGRATIDLRFSTPIEKSGVINGALISGDQGIPGARVLVPGAPGKSMLHLRLTRPPNDPLRMPPACPHPESPPVLELLEKWIREFTPAR